MTGIFNGIQSLIDTILGPIHYVANIIEMAINAMGYIYKAVVNIMGAIVLMPVWLQTIAAVTIAIAVVYQLMGREQGR